MRIARIVALALVGLLAPQARAAEIPAEKYELIVELVGISTGPEGSVPVVRRFLQELQPHYASLVADVMTAETDLEAAQRAALEKQLADFDAFAVEHSRFSFSAELQILLCIESARKYDPLAANGDARVLDG